MSHIATSKTSFTERQYLEDAIMDLLLTKDREPITAEHFLSGTATDSNGTSFESEFYISRQVLGTTYGDLGFNKSEDGTYNLISDMGYDYVQTTDKDSQLRIRDFANRLNARYAAQKLEAEALETMRREGCEVEKEILEDGSIRLLVKLSSLAV